MFALAKAKWDQPLARNIKEKKGIIIDEEEKIATSAKGYEKIITRFSIARKSLRNANIYFAKLKYLPYS